LWVNTFPIRSKHDDVVLLEMIQQSMKVGELNTTAEEVGTLVDGKGYDDQISAKAVPVNLQDYAQATLYDPDYAQ
jgi:hypothetical protein